jgi:hypothetical protein
MWLIGYVAILPVLWVNHDPCPHAWGGNQQVRSLWTSCSLAASSAIKEGQERGPVIATAIVYAAQS